MWRAPLTGSGAEARAFARLGVALAKFLGNKLCPGVIYEAMEALGGMGYVEDTPLPMLYREAPLNSIWEGSGNVICLDILRTLAREPAAGEALSAELGAVAGQDRRFDAAMRAHMQAFPKPPEEAQARWYAESLATLLTASVLMRHAPGAVAGGLYRHPPRAPRGRVAGATRGIDTGAVLARLGGSE